MHSAHLVRLPRLGPGAGRERRRVPGAAQGGPLAGRLGHYQSGEALGVQGIFQLWWGRDRSAGEDLFSAAELEKPAAPLRSSSLTSSTAFKCILLTHLHAAGGTRGIPAPPHPHCQLRVGGGPAHPRIAPRGALECHRSAAAGPCRAPSAQAHTWLHASSHIACQPGPAPCNCGPIRHPGLPSALHSPCDRPSAVPRLAPRSCASAARARTLHAGSCTGSSPRHPPCCCTTGWQDPIPCACPSRPPAPWQLMQLETPHAPPLWQRRGECGCRCPIAVSKPRVASRRAAQS
jgi:hypothetical protein